MMPLDQNELSEVQGDSSSLMSGLAPVTRQASLWGATLPTVTSHAYTSYAAFKNGTFLRIRSYYSFDEEGRPTLPGGGNLFFEIHNADGSVKLPPPFSLGLTGLNPQAVTLSDGRVLIVWENQDTNSAGDHIKTSIECVILNQDGTAAMYRVLKQAANWADSYYTPKIAATPDGGFVVSTWHPADRTVQVESYDKLGTITNSRVYGDGPNVSIVQGGVLAAGGGRVLSLDVYSNGSGVAEYVSVKSFFGNNNYSTVIATGVSKDTKFSLSHVSDDVWAVAFNDGFRPVVKFYNYTGGSDKTPIAVFDGISSNYSAFSIPKITSLGGGKVALVWGWANQIQTMVISQDGSVFSSQQVVGSAGNDELVDIEVDALADGRYVVNWKTKKPGEFGDYIYTSSRIVDPRIDTSVNSTAGVSWNDPDVQPHQNFQYAGTVRNDTLDGNEGQDILYGHDGDDFLYGGAGNDSLLGGEGLDILMGGAGADTLNGGAGWNMISYSDAASGVKAVRFDTNLNEGDAVGDVYVNDTFRGLEGSAYADQLHGWWDNEEIYGRGGDDHINGYQGDDHLEGNEGRDRLDGQIGNDRLLGGSGNDSLYGGDGSDLLEGGDNDDYFEGGHGRVVIVSGKSQIIGDTIKGGEGRDEANYWDSDAAVRVDLSIGKGTGGHAEGDLLESIEILTGSLNFSDTLIGSASDEEFRGLGGSDTIISGGGKDTLNGGAGDDYLEGGDGDDLYSVDSAGDRIIEGNSATSGYDQIGSFVDFNMQINAQNVEEIWAEGVFVLGGAGLKFTGNSLGNKITGHMGNDLLLGVAGDDRLVGAEGDDRLDGGIGRDTLDGGIGADMYAVDQSDDLVEETGTDGAIDTVIVTGTGVSYTLTDLMLVEKLEAGLNVAVGTLKGNRYANEITADAGNNTLEGGAGDDILSGGAGRDSLVGGADNDLLDGGDEDDLLDGGSGADTLKGGSGNDTYHVLGNDKIEESIGAGFDRVYVHGDEYTLTGGAEVEELRVGGILNASRKITGNEFAQKIIGGSAGDVLDGGENSAGQGADTFNGGAGNDVYYIRNAGDVVEGERVDDGDGTFSTTLNGDNDVAHVYGKNYLTAGVFDRAKYDAEVQRLHDLGIETVIAHDVPALGTGGDDTLDGSEPFDTLIGGAGDDTYHIRDVNDRIEEVTDPAGGFDMAYIHIGEFALDDTVGIEALIVADDVVGGGNIIGNSLANTLKGGSGDDTLDGNGGDDSLEGAAGSDTYVIDSLNDVITEQTGQGTDTVVLKGGAFGPTYTLNIAHVENVTAHESAGEITLIGDDNANTLTGNVSSNTLEGGGGADTLDGGNGIADKLVGGSGNDAYIIRNQNDVIEEVAKAAGGSNDVAEVHAEIYDLADGVGIELLKAADIDKGVHLIGNNYANTLQGNQHNDTLDGGSGAVAHTLDGGAGNDVYYIRKAGDVIEGERIDIGGGVYDTTLNGDDDVAHLYAENYFTNGAFDRAKYSAEVQRLHDLGIERVIGHNLPAEGTDGSDTLDGSEPTDTMIGGAGNDTYHIRDVSDRIVESTDPSGGFDTAIIHIGEFTLADTVGVEELQVGDDVFSGVSLTGNVLSNTIKGGVGDDILKGGGAAAGEKDLLIGNGGHDTYVISSLDNVTLVETDGLTNGRDTIVLENSQLSTFTLLDNFENLTAGVGTGAIELIGNGAANQITGSARSNVLRGELGNDTLDGGGGKDRLAGGSGDDTYIIRHALDVIEEGLDTLVGGAADVAVSYVSRYQLADNVGVEVLKAKNDSYGDANRNGEVDGAWLVGNSYAGQTLQGWDHADTLDGGSAAVAHTLSGGARNDVYIIRNVGDQVLNEGAGNGTNDVAYILKETFGEDTNARNLYVDYLKAQGIEIVHTDVVLAPPTDIALSKLTIHEHAAAGSVVGFLSAVDAPGEVIGYELLDDSGGRFALAGDALSGYRIVVKNGAKLDFEQALAHGGVYKIKLRASDGLAVSEEVEVEIVVTDTSIESTHGSADSDLIKAGGGADQLGGGQGNDTLHGGLGNDVLTGGDGHDVFVFDTAPDRLGNMDVIRDFTVAGGSSDQIWLLRDVFGALSGTGDAVLTTDQFHIGVQATAAEHRIIYNKATGALSYDADGSGAGEAVQFAKLSPLLSLTADHFLLYSGRIA